MIVKNIIDFSRISYEGNKAANAGHAAYWLAAQHDEDLSGALRVQEDAIIEGFTHMAAMLGYRIEKIDADPAPVTDVTVFKPRVGLSETGVPV